MENSFDNTLGSTQYIDGSLIDSKDYSKLHDRIREALHLKDRSPELTQNFNAEQVIDDDSVVRTVYSFVDSTGNKIKISFTPREELPIIPELMSDRQPFLLARQPKWRTQDDWNQYWKKFSETAMRGVPEPRLNPGSISETTRKQNISFVVQENLQSLVDAAGLLGYSNPELQKVRLLLSQNRADHVVDDLTDMIIAAKIFDDAGEYKYEPDTEGEALMLAYLCGDKKASEILMKRLDALHTSDRENNEKNHEMSQGIIVRDEKSRLREIEQLDAELVSTKKLDYSASIEEDIIKGINRRRHETETMQFEALDPKELVAVHATAYEPRKTATGWELHSAFDGSDRTQPRQTVHFAMNHLVESHDKGDWDNMPVVVISSFEGMLQTAGKPRKLNTVDTYWEISPGRKLELPKDQTVIIKPGKVQDGQKIWEKQDGVVVYRTGPYSLADMEWMLSEIDSEVIEDINDDVSCSLRNSALSKCRNYHEGAQILFQQEKDSNFLKKLHSPERYKIFSEIFDAMNLHDSERAHMQTKMIAVIRNKMDTIVRRAIVNQQMREMGYEVHKGGQHGWSDDGSASMKMSRLGAKLGIVSGAHFRSSEWELEGMLESAMIGVRDGELGARDFHDAMHEIGSVERIASATPSNRRAMYEMGAIT